MRTCVLTRGRRRIADGRRRGCDTWMRVAYSAALALLQETMRRAFRAHGARSRRQRRSAWRPEASHLRLLPGAVSQAPE